MSPLRRRLLRRALRRAPRARQSACSVPPVPPGLLPVVSTVRRLDRATIRGDRGGDIGSAYASSRSRLPISTPLHAAPAHELVHDRLEAPALLGQPVLDGRRAGVQYAPVEEARFD